MARLISTCACVTTALLSFGLVCGRALIKTRHILFSNLEFTKNEDFEQFLKLVDAPWTSFTLAIKEIHLTDLFHPHDHDYRDQIDSTRIASNLCNVKSLSIFAHRLWISGWKVIPRSVLDVIFQLKIHDLPGHLGYVDGQGHGHVVPSTTGVYKNACIPEAPIR